MLRPWDDPCGNQHTRAESSWLIKGHVSVIDLSSEIGMSRLFCA